MTALLPEIEMEQWYSDPSVYSLHLEVVNSARVRSCSSMEEAVQLQIALTRYSSVRGPSAHCIIVVGSSNLRRTHSEGASPCCYMYVKLRSQELAPYSIARS